MFRKVLSVHGTNHPELRRINSEFEGLASELLDHMIDEEIVLFPYIKRVEQCGTGQSPIEPSGLSSLRPAVATLVFQHDSAGGKLRAIRQASGDYRVPEDACMTYRAVFRALAELEADLHQHIHLKNNILFPRATAVEEMLAAERGGEVRNRLSTSGDIRRARQLRVRFGHWYAGTHSSASAIGGQF